MRSGLQHILAADADPAGSCVNVGGHQTHNRICGDRFPRTGFANQAQQFSLRYFDGTTWQEGWDSTLYDDSLPLSVAVTLELGNPNSDKPGQRISRVIAFPCAKNSLISGTSSSGSTGGVQ